MARITVKYDVTKIIEETIEVPFDETYIENNEFESIEELRETINEYFDWDADFSELISQPVENELKIISINEEDIDVLVEKYKHLVKEPKEKSCCDDYKDNYSFKYCPECGKSLK